MSKHFRTESMKIQTPLRVKRLALVREEKRNRAHEGWILHNRLMTLAREFLNMGNVKAAIAADDYANLRVQQDSNSVTIARLMGMQAI